MIAGGEAERSKAYLENGAEEWKNNHGQEESSEPERTWFSAKEIWLPCT